MRTQTLAMDWIFQPARWQPLRWVAEWLRDWTARQHERRQAPRRMIANLAANYLDGTDAPRHVVKDVSAGGAFIFANFKWPLGTIVTMTLQLEEPVRGHRPAAPVLLRTKSGPLRAGWTWGSVSGPLQHGAPAPYGFSEEYPGIPTFTVRLYRDAEAREMSALQASWRGVFVTWDEEKGN